MADVKLPEGWCISEIGEISLKCTQRAPKTGEDFIYVDIGSINRELKIIESPQYLSGDNAPSRARKVIEKGDVLVSLTRPNLNAVALVTDNYDGQIASTGFEVIKPLLVNSEYIFSLTRSLHFIDSISGVVQGALYPAAKSSDVQKYEFPLPPLAEQKVIAEKLDALLAQVDSAKTRLEQIPQILKRFRQSVLTAAVSGKLTEEWRKTKTLKPVSELFSKYTYVKNSANLAEKPFRVDEIVETIPNSWMWVRLAKITEIVSGIAKGSKSNEETMLLPYLRVANVQRGYLDLNEVKKIPVPASKFEKLKLISGDILFNEGGDIDKLGRGWIWQEQIENCIHQNHVFRARPYCDEISSKFISFYGNSNGKDYFLREGTQSVNLANINKTTLSLLPIPLPPIEEQTEIVRRVEQLFAFADTIEKQVQDALLRVNNLTQSILAKAFRGELTEQWRAENPDLISGENSAETLLAKIKAERETAKPKKKTAK
ncbi:restriction endonuclease subunit S [Hafnia psychrotolerans]|uniref:Type I restriction-modification system restriction endonuclease DNA specificity subunit HsdS n=1 Tax=Hafnia psychrotolerans TaxID=1477018 RepID=A0ABQ1H6R0_9GAMM|nr:type I restriction-modification system restriction endonuclease DNA specificity subunit HsdS [Hafnia psychrotolerans]